MYKSGEYWKFNPINLHKVHFQQRYFWKFPYFCISPQKPSYAHLFHLRRKNYVIISWMSGHTLLNFGDFFKYFSNMLSTFRCFKCLLYWMMLLLSEIKTGFSLFSTDTIHISDQFWKSHQTFICIGIYGITLSELSRIKSILLY